MAINEPEDEDIEEFEIPDDDEAGPPPDMNRAGIVAMSAILASSAMFLAALHRTLGGMRHHTALESLSTIRIMLVIGIVVILLGAHALKVTRPFEGTVLRGAAIAASALSFIAELLLATSFHELMRISLP